MSACPCGRDLDYSKCCGPIIKKEALAKTSEDLMRARYSAFAKGEVDFIIHSNHTSSRDELSRDEIKNWSENSIWLGLEIVSTEGGGESDKKGMVEFIANYQVENQKLKHHERSSFERSDGEWFFVDGEILRDVVQRVSQKVGRNEPCPCGSGKKYKKCCGA